MCKDNDYKEVCSVSQLADKLSISRERFYQHLRAGVFPPPIYCPCMKRRPFYTQDLQQQCITIRRTGIGYNGKLVLFYGKRKARKKVNRTMPKEISTELHQRLTKNMKQIGFNVTINDVIEAVKVIHPEGLTINEPDEEIIQTLYSYFKPKG